MQGQDVADLRKRLQKSTANVTVEAAESKAFAAYVDAQLADIFAAELV
jgi:hypothetical protein